MRISETESFFEKCMDHSMQVLLVGGPGVGKTTMPMTLCQRRGWDYIGICCPLFGPAFFSGYPFKTDNNHADHLPFGPLYRALKAEKPTLFFLDELGGCAEETIKSALRFVQFREVGNHHLPDHVLIAAASNDVGHGAGVMGLLEPMKDRFQTIVNVEAHVDDTVVFGLANGWPTDLLAFLRNDPTSLMDWKPVKSMQSGGATPRGWGDVARWINAGIDIPEVICGKVGKAAGSKYLAFRELINELPDVNEVLLNPASAPVPDNPSARWLIATALSAKITAGNFGQALTYLNRITGMFRAYAIRDAFKSEAAKRADKKLPQGWKPLSSSRDFVAWACSEDGKDVMSAAS